MSDLSLYLLKANIALILFYLGYYLWLRKLTFYGPNRYYLVFALVFSAIYPLIPMDTWFVSGPEIPANLLLALSDWQHIQFPEETTGTSNSISVAYWISVGLFGFLFLVKLKGIIQIHFGSVPAHWDRFQYRKSKENISPFSFWTNIYFNPRLHREEEYLKIFKHEQVHVRQLHSLDILLAETALIFFWYNPFCWMMRKAIQENIEFVTDQQVLASGMDRKSYQYSLIQISTLSSPSHLGNHFNFKNLKKRIIMMNKNRSSNMQLGKYVFIFPAVVIGSLIFGISNANENHGTQSIQEISATIPQDTLKFKGTKDEPLYIIDGQKQSTENMSKINNEDIEAINVIKDKAAIAAYGEEAKHGVIEVTTKKGTKEPLVEMAANKSVVKISENSTQGIGSNENRNEDKKPAVMHIQNNKIISLKTGNDNVLLFVDGKKIANKDLAKLNPNDIKGMSVFKGEKAIERYGAEGKDGVIEITTKGKN